jgi:hypothetical protein
VECLQRDVFSGGVSGRTSGHGLQAAPEGDRLVVELAGAEAMEQAAEHDRLENIAAWVKRRGRRRSRKVGRLPTSCPAWTSPRRPLLKAPAHHRQPQQNRRHHPSRPHPHPFRIRPPTGNSLRSPQCQNPAMDDDLLLRSRMRLGQSVLVLVDQASEGLAAFDPADDREGLNGPKDHHNELRHGFRLRRGLVSAIRRIAGPCVRSDRPARASIRGRTRRLACRPARFRSPHA